MVARCPGSHCRALGNNTNRGLGWEPNAIAVVPTSQSSAMRMRIRKVGMGNPTLVLLMLRCTTDDGPPNYAR